MTDKEIEGLILFQIRKRGITWLDMFGGPCVSYEADHERVCRNNVFKSGHWSERLIELLCDGHYNPHGKDHVMQVSIQDLMRFWWNVCIDQEDMLDDIFEDIFTYFKDKLKPQEKEEPTPEHDIDFDKVFME